MPRGVMSKISLDELLNALKKHQARLPKLQRKARKLKKQLAAVETEINALGGIVEAAPAGKAKRGRAVKAGRRTRKRARNKVKLADAIAGVLNKDKALSVPQIAAAVKSAGYKSTSKSFQTIIYQTLARDKRIKRAGRGQYVLKG